MAQRPWLAGTAEQPAGAEASHDRYDILPGLRFTA